MRKNKFQLAGPAGWIGVDLNTTGFAVVAADPVTGHILRLGRRPSSGKQEIKNCTKFYREQTMWKLKKYRTREQKKFRSSLCVIAKKIVYFAEHADAGIRFERLFSKHALPRKTGAPEIGFSFENASFPHLLRLVEKYATPRGIPVQYIDPTNTSKRCSRCGSLGHRVRKRFSCPCCGVVIHADVNAAFNIAMTSRSDHRAEEERIRTRQRKLRRIAREMAEAMPHPDAFAGMSGARYLTGPWTTESARGARP